MTGSQRIAVRVTPRSSQDRIVGRDAESGVVEIRVKAAPVDNAANEAVIKLMSKALKVPKSHIRIVRGAKSRDKIIEIDADSSILRRIVPK